ncbi:PepSY domain-containing protein [Alkalihalobacillus pseudalcaliphilus]|uniref:PepSY domain-containing protein n=1 Tax=Alkalihalobacillus pseudalcaliphilus TaxID=79884 RepID=UPI00064DB32C|nr:PepSY domain-containing protein [Alkalihalobacillus pseudalcaliphilus]KMK75213.1 hypothetical protein AB990_17430 [Alkalihalobacillus pseudalcaliphilus]
MKKVMIGLFTAAILFGGTAWVSANMSNSHEQPKEIALSYDLATTNEQEGEKFENTETEELKEEETEQTEQNILSIEEAQAVALDVQKGLVDHIELTMKKGKAYYEVEIKHEYMEYEMYIDAYNGEVIRVEEERDDDFSTSKVTPLFTNDVLTLEEVLQLLEGKVEGDLVELSLERDDHMLVYELEFKTDQGVETEVELNAETGDIFEIDVD